MVRLNYLKKVTFFSELEESDLKKIVQIGKNQRFLKDKTIFNENTSGERFYIVLSGRIKIFTRSGEKKKTLAILDRGEFFGEMALLDMEPRSASSIALTESELVVIKKQDFRKLLAKYPRISFQIMKTLSQRLRQADKEIEALTFGDVIGRLANTLLEFGKKYGQETQEGLKINMAFSHQDIAEVVGTGREMVSRVLNRFKRLNCITYSNRFIVLTDQNKLKQWVR
ncbi:MAG: Crp/Fnr family transcriptional regulator [Elusimicrobia bacterium]|nr:Crp/Fnr family transcriptional regulator [Candidatus Liberimonas magnetica]